MNVRVSQSSLSRILRDAQRATAGKTTLDILKGIKLEADTNPYEDWMTATGTDLHVGISSTATGPIRSFGEVHHGTVVVDADTLVAFVSSLDKLAVIDLVSDGKALTVTAGRSTASFALMPVDDFPAFGSDLDWQDWFTTDSETLTRSLASGAWSVGNSGDRPFMQGIYAETTWQALRTSSTNGFAFSRMTQPFDASEISAGTSAMIPSKTVAILGSTLKVPAAKATVQLGGNLLRVVTDGVTVTSGLIDAKFPDLSHVIDQSWEAEFEVDAYLLMNAVLQTRMFKDDTNQHITIASESPDLLHITSPSLERGNATAVIPASAITRDVRFSVDAVTFNAAVSACASARIWIGVNPSRSVTIRPIDGMDLTQVLAPVVKGKRDE